VLSAAAPYVSNNGCAAEMEVKAVGPKYLSNTELIAAVWQTPDALNQAQQVMGTFGRLSGLVKATEQEITTIDGIGPASAARIKAALELSKRMMHESLEDKFVVRSPADVAQLLMVEMSNLEQEHFKVLILDTRNRLLADETIYVGSLNASHVRVCEIYREATGATQPRSSWSTITRLVIRRPRPRTWK